MLVKITEFNKEDVLTVSSREVAEDFGKRHTHVLDNIKSLIENIDSAENSAQYFWESTYKDSSGKTNKEYLLTRDGFSLLVMGFSGVEAMRWKLNYIKAFNEMEKELKRLYEERKKWEIERAKGVVIRHALTDTIKMKIADSPNKRFVYPNYTKLIYKYVLGKSFNELRKEYDIKAKEGLRDYLPSEQLRELESAEMLVSSLINIGWGYAQIKSFLEENSTKSLSA